MFPSVYVSDIAKGLHAPGSQITLHGWLYNKRSSGKLHFLQLRDGTGVIQCVVSKKEVPEATRSQSSNCSSSGFTEIRYIANYSDISYFVKGQSTDSYEWISVSFNSEATILQQFLHTV